MPEVEPAADRIDTVICARCGETSAPGYCAACGGDTRLDGRYELIRRLGHGASGTTFEARRIADGDRVAIKELLVRRLEDFKTHDLFTREAKVLETLDHPGIPRYYDDFSAGEGRQLGLYLVTELIDGLTLEEEQKLHRHTQEEVVRIGLEVARILAYLHAFAPPVVHRDLKPSNIMRRKGDAGLVVIDFGAVKESLRESGGSTVAGTFGFMPPEQLAGRATPATDLYALGATMIVLMTRRPIGELIDQQNRLQWESALPSGTPLADGLRHILRDVLEPDASSRLADANALALRLEALLEGRYEVPATSAPNARPQSPQIPKAFLDMLPGGFGQLFESLQQAGIQPGTAEAPPPTPRRVPWGMVGRADPIAGFFRMFGVLFGGIPLVVFIGLIASGIPDPAMLFVGLFPAIGGTLATIGFLRAGRLKRLYRHGRAVEAVVTEVDIDTRLKVNGRSPYGATFRYKAPDGDTSTKLEFPITACSIQMTPKTSSSRMRMRPDLRVPGARVWALYDETKPDRATLWPIE
ncbi:MAG TPA: protein kinase [Myxococcota bacterium]|nr:protein kinase [Myxococcota bacterium]